MTNENIKITEAGIYDIPDHVYHADPCPEPSLSNSIAKKLIQTTPLHAWLAHPRLNKDCEAENKTAWDIGRAGHALMLKEPTDFVIINDDAYRKKATKEQRDQAWAEHKTPLLTHQFDQINEMVESGRRQMANSEELHPFLAEDSQSEQTLIWQEDGLWFRSKADRISKDRMHIFDYKTTGGPAHAEKWSSICFTNFFDMQVKFYERFFQAMYNGLQPQFNFIVQEIEPPYLLTHIRLDGIALEMAQKRVEHAIKIWRLCMEKNIWPGYPNKPVYISPPYGQSRSWLEAEGNENATMRSDMLRLMFEMQGTGGKEHDFKI